MKIHTDGILTIQVQKIVLEENDGRFYSRKKVFFMDPYGFLLFIIVLIWLE